MIKTSKQLKDLIRNRSKKKAADAQMLMRHYMMERFLAEKLETIIARKTTNTRMRDFYDLHSLLQWYEEDMNPVVFNQALMV
jgi:predicted nucleotidyltransferase component of viral defense system